MTGPANTGPQDTGSFLRAILNVETGIDPVRLDEYRQARDRKVMRYWKVHGPGHIWRSPADGLPKLEGVSYPEYFDRIGLPHPKAIESVEDLRRRQFSVINPWGYVGFQLGEALLAETGHYRPAWHRLPGQTELVPSYYCGELPAHAWAGETTISAHVLADTGQMIAATDRNRWDGSFTGLGGISSFLDLCAPDLQTVLFKGILQHNAARIRLRIIERGYEEAELLEAATRKLGQSITYSGLLAGAHLCGVEGAVGYLTDLLERQDETGTKISQYLIDFSGYNLDPLVTEEIAERTQ